MVPHMKTLPRCNHCNTCVGVDAACCCLRVARSRYSGAAVEHPHSGSSDNRAVELVFPRARMRWPSRFAFMVYFPDLVLLLEVVR
jgi:hypothetical protein